MLRHDVSTTKTETPDDSKVEYAYRASLVGGARHFELTDDGLSWSVGSKSGVWRYTDIASIRLSYRPVSMQSRRFRADIESRSGQSVAIFSTTWQSVALMAPQDADYRAFITQLHRRLECEGARVALTAGLGPTLYAVSIAMLALVAVAMTGLLARAIATGAWAGALFLVGFAALFVWQIGGFMRRNKPRIYNLNDVPEDLLP